MLAALIALTAAALFTGAAAYVSFVEQPARLKLDDRALLAEWGPSYARGKYMQASLAIVSGLAGAYAWWDTGSLVWLAGAILILANWPYTLLVILPTNRRLETTKPENANAETRRLLVKWGWLHCVRTALGAGATAVFFAALFIFN